MEDAIINKILNDFDRSEAAFKNNVEDKMLLKLFESLQERINGREFTDQQLIIIKDRIDQSRELFASKNREITQTLTDQTMRTGKLERYIQNSNFKR